MQSVKLCEQYIITPNGGIFPLIVEGSLCYLPQQLPTDWEMYELPQVLMGSSKSWDSLIYNSKFTIKEHLCGLLAIPAGTCKDMYDKERNIVLSAKVDNVDDIIVTTVDDNGNTLVSVIDDDVDSVSIINLADDSISLELVDCSDGDVPDVLPSWSSSRSRCRLSHTKRYQPSSPKLLKPHTNKHKSYCSFVSTYDALDDDDETVPGLSNRFHTPCSFPLTSSSAVLLPSQYDSVLQDDVNGELYFDALEDIDPDLSKHLGHYVNIGDFTFSNDNPLSVFWDPDQGSSDLHGERIYRHMLGADICVFVTKSEDDGLHPYDHTFWVKCFHRANISHHIYQSVLDYAAQVSIESLEVHDILEPSSPRITTPTKIDHKVMWPFFAWMPVEHICKTFEHTTQFMRILLSTYL